MTRRAIALLLLLTVATITMAFPNEITSRGYLDIKNSECWPCHEADTVPLREVVEVASLGGEAALEEELSYEVRVDNAWLADIIRLEGGLNIANAPSLAFTSTQPPSLGESTRGVIPPIDFANTAEPTSATQQQSNYTFGFVDAGVTDLKITVTPDNTDPVIGPQFEIRFYPGRTSIPTTPTQTDYRIESPGAGQSAVLHLKTGADVADAGFGSWLVEVRSIALDAAGSPTQLLSEVPYTVTFDKYYNVTGENVQFLSKTVQLEGGQSTVFGWILQAVSEPGSDEYVLVNMNTTTKYLHEANSYPDFSYTNREFRFSVEPGGEGVQLEGDKQASTGQTVESKLSLPRISEVIGYVSAVLLIASVYTGGMFGKATRRQQNKWFGSAKRRVAFHNFLSYGIITTAIIHTVIFIGPWEGLYVWTNGLIWGGIAILAMLALGVTGAIQVQMIRKWNYSTWRWTHFGLAIAAIVFTIVHMVLDGANLAGVFEFGWKDPFDSRI